MSVQALSRLAHLSSLPHKRSEISVPPENELVKRCEELFRIAKEYRDNDLKMSRRWRSNRSWYLSTGRDRGILSPTITYVNLIYEKCEKLFADVTEAMPVPLYTARDVSEVDMADYLQHCAEGVWEERDGDRKYRISGVKPSIIYGTWIWKIVHDPGYGGRNVGVDIRPVPCYRIFPAPYATDIESAPWIIEVCPRPVDEIFNDYGVRVQPEIEVNDLSAIHEDMADPRGKDVTYGTNLTGTSVVPLFPSSFGVGPKSQAGQAIAFQKELWIRDPATEARYWIEGTKQGPEMRHGKDLLYPKGRYIGWANGKQLYDGENPYLDGRFPYVRFIDNPFPEFFWGMGEVPNLINLQLLHDDTLDTMRRIHAYMPTGRVVIDETTGLRDKELSGDPEEIWWTKRNTQERMRIFPPIVPPAEFYSHLNSIERWVDLLTGSFDVTRGVNPTGVTAARALVALQRAAGIRVRGRMREMEDTMKEAFRMIGSRIQQFGPSRIDYLDQKNSYRSVSISEDQRLSPFEVKVDIVSNLDDLRSLEFQKLLLLFNLGAAKKSRLIESSGLSTAETLLKELPEATQERMAVAQAMATAQAPPGMPQSNPNVGQVATDLSATQKSIGRSLRSTIE